MFEYGFPKHWTTLKKLIFLSLFLDGSGEQIVWTTVSGMSPLALANALAKPIRSLTQYGKCVQNGTPTPDSPVDILCNNGAIKARHQSGLPLGYTLLAYARSAGTQYIDLGYKGNGNTKVEVKYKYYEASTATGSGRVFGSRIAAQEDAFAFGTSAGIVAATETNKVFWCYDSQPYFVINENFGLNVWKTVVFSAKEHTIDGVSAGDDYEIVSFETPQNLKLFGFDQLGTMGVGYVDVEYCKLWDNGVLVRDLVPAKNASDVVGMYDLVSGQFFTNAGTGDFAAGAPIDDPVEIYAGGTHPGKNLVNVNQQTALVGYYISAQGVVSADPNNWMYQNYIRVKPNTAYTLSMSQSVYYVTISEYSTAADSGFVVRKTGSSGSNTSLTITTGETTNFLRFGANIERAEVTLERVLAINWQLEEGAEATAYEPYTETPYQPEVLTVSADGADTQTVTDIPMLLSVGDIEDELEFVGGPLTHRIGIKVFDGTETPTAMSTAGAYRFAGASNVENLQNTMVLCTHYKPESPSKNVANMDDLAVKTNATANNNIYFKDTSCQTAADLQAKFAALYAAGTPVILLVVLVEETAEQGTAHALHSYNGTTIITAETNVDPVELEVEYAASA